MKKGIKIFLALLLLIVIYLSFDIHLNLSLREKIAARTQLNNLITQSDQITILSDSTFYIDHNNEEICDYYREEGIILLNVRWLIPLGFTYNYDETNKKLSFIGEDVFVILDESGKASVNGENVDDNVILRTINNDHYIAMEDFFKLSPKSADRLIVKGDKERGWAVVYSNDLDLNTSSAIDDDIFVFNTMAQNEAYKTSKPNNLGVRDIFKSYEVVGVLNEGELIKSYPVDETTAFVYSQNGFIGYVDTSDISSIEPAPTNENLGLANDEDDIVLIWEAVYSGKVQTDVIPELGNVNVISPTWYTLNSASGDITSKADLNYMNWAESQGYTMWVLVSNQFDPELTHQFLYNTDSRALFIESIILEAKKYAYDGINVDFENIYLDDKDALTHFINELTWEAHKNNLIVSMDVTVMGGSDQWSKCYDRETLGKIVDYLIIMTYDEYWASSPVSGPVASYDWVNEKIRQILEIVPKEKVIMGIPLYSRVWYETISKDQINKMDVTSKSISMTTQNRVVTEKNLTPLWSDKDRLYYVSYLEDDIVKKIWIETPETIAEKINLAVELNLAGYAYWRRGLETENFWEELTPLIER